MHPIPRRLLAALLWAATLPVAAQLAEEVPFITSPDNVTLEMLRLANVGPADHVIDLGSGDGRIVILAAKRFGASGLGVEIVPELVERSLRTARETGVADRVDFKLQDLFRTDLSRASVVSMYLLPEVNLQLRPTLLQLRPGTRVVSHDWDMGDWLPDQTTVVPVPDKKVGLEKSSKIHLWVVPARVDGLWCGLGLLREFRLQLAQRHQNFEAKLMRKTRTREVRGRIEGVTLRTEERRDSSLVLEAADNELRVVGGTGQLAMARGQRFARAQGDSCPG
ncbi:MAG TPA: methyltransferase domain-containing protein [Ramlibacter sp.]|nr:methyltransferase domain-containing protein [Ramlibacter sp.]